MPPVPAGLAIEASSREKILDTAEALFARLGFAGVGLREVAERVGLGKSSLFHHFPSKVQLYAAVLERVLLEIEARLRTALEGSGRPPQRLERWVESLVDLLAESPTRAPLLLRTFFEGDVVGVKERIRLDAALQRILSATRSLLADGIASGDFRAASIPHTVQTLIGMTIYHFASNEFGDDLLGQPLYSASEVHRRKEEIQSFLRCGLAAPREARDEG